MPHNLGPTSRTQVRTGITLSLAAVALAIYSASTWSQDVTQSLVRIEGTRADGSRFTTVAVGVSVDTLIASCRSLADAVALNAIGAKGRTPLTLASIAAPDDLCQLAGARGAVFAPMSPRASVSVGGSVTLIAQESSAGSEWRSISVNVKEKRDGGNRRAIYFEPPDSTTSGAGSQAWPAFDSTGRFIGVATSVPGNQKVLGLLQVEDAAMIKWRAVATGPSAKGKPGAKGPLVPSDLHDKLGVTLTYADLASAYGRTRNYDKALALAERWKTNDPTNPMAYAVAAIVLNRLHFAEQSSRDLDQALTLSPQYLQATAAKVSILDRQGKKTEAEILATKALEIPASDNLDESERVFLLVYLKRNDEAVQLARRVLAAEPQAQYSKAAVCAAEFGAKHADSALSACKEYVTAVPDSTNGWGRLSFVYLGGGRYDDSLEAAKKVIEINPEVADGWMLIGLVGEARGESARASEAEQHVQELDPSLLPRLKSGRAAQGCYREMRNRNYSSAVSACSDAARLDEQNGSVQSTLGAALLRDKRLDDGIAAHEKAVRLNPNNKGSWNDLVMAYATKRDAAKTRDAFYHLKTLDPTAADALYPKIRNVLN